MNAIEEFEAIINAIYGVYLDSTTGFREIRERFEASQQNSLSLLKEKHPELATLEYLDQTLFIYGKGDPNSREAIWLHKCTQGQYKKRNSDDGLNFLFISNMALVSMYQFWEDHYRSAIAGLLGETKNSVSEPVMGDIRLLRHSIIHHAGIALPEVDRCEVLTWFREGEMIFLDKAKFEFTVSQIKKMLQRHKERHERAQQRLSPVETTHG